MRGTIRAETSRTGLERAEICVGGNKCCMERSAEEMSRVVETEMCWRTKYSEDPQ